MSECKAFVDGMKVERKRVLKIIRDFKEYDFDRGWTAKIKREMLNAVDALGETENKNE